MLIKSIFFLVLSLWTAEGIAACTIVTGINCDSPGGTNQLYTNAGSYYRNSTCTQSCSCFDALAGCPGCPYESPAGSCFTNTSCGKACTPVPEQAAFGRLGLCAILIALLAWPNRRKKRNKKIT